MRCHFGNIFQRGDAGAIPPYRFSLFKWDMCHSLTRVALDYRLSPTGVATIKETRQFTPSKICLVNLTI